MDSQLLNSVLVLIHLGVDLVKLALAGSLSLVLVSSEADGLALDVLELLLKLDEVALVVLDDFLLDSVQELLLLNGR